MVKQIVSMVRPSEIKYTGTRQAPKMRGNSEDRSFCATIKITTKIN